MAYSANLSIRLSILSTPYRPAQNAVFPFTWYAAVLSSVATSVWKQAQIAYGPAGLADVYNDCES